MWRESSRVSGHRVARLLSGALAGLFVVVSPIRGAAGAGRALPPDPAPAHRPAAPLRMLPLDWLIEDDQESLRSPFPDAVPDGGGGAIVAWMDYRNGSRELYAQRIAADGSLRWGRGGIPVCRANGWQKFVALAPDGAGGAYVAWSDTRDCNDYDLYVQRLGPDGTARWGTDGIALDTSPGAQWVPRIAGDGEGGALIAWLASGPDGVFAQRVSGDGVPQWAAGGVPLDPAPSGNHRLWDGNPVIASDGAGGAIVAWVERQVLAPWQYGLPSVHAQRIGAAGVPLWESGGIPVGADALEAGFPELCADGHGGATLVWLASRVNASTPHLYAQRLDRDGVDLWEPGGRVLCSPQGQEQSPPEMVGDGVGGFVVTWADARHGGSLFAQRLTPAGTTLWPDDGVLLASPLESAPREAWPRVAPDGNGGAIVAWTEWGGGDADVHVQRVDGTGAVRWGPRGVRLSARDGWQWLPVPVPDGRGGAIVAWADDRAAIGELSAQRVSADGAREWRSGGVPLSRAGASQIHPAVVADHEGGAIVAWAQRRDGDSDLALRRFGPDGFARGPATTLCAAPGDQTLPTLVGDGEGGAFLVWEDERSGAPVLHAQRVDRDGAPAWAAEGVPVCDAPGARGPAVAVADGRDGLIVAWQADRGSGARAFAQRLGPDGARAWGAEGLALGDGLGEGSGPAIVPDGEGGAFVVWEERGGADLDIHVQHLTAGGALTWAGGGLPVCAAPGDQVRSAAAPDGGGGLFIVWQDHRAGRPDIFAQRLDAGGQAAWAADGVPLWSDTTLQCAPAIAAVAPGEAIVAWQDHREWVPGGGGPHQGYRIRAQRIDIDGGPAWVAGGVAMGHISGHAPRIEADGVGGAYVTWSRFSHGWTVHAQHVDAAGMPRWPETALEPYGSGGPHYHAATTGDGQGGLLVAWQDGRDLTQDAVRVQRLGEPGAPLWTARADAPSLLLLESAVPAPGVVRLEWSAPAQTDLALTLYRREVGTTWTPRASLRAESGGRVMYEDHDVAAGARYGYRLGVDAPGGERFFGEAWVVVPGPFALALAGPRPQPAIGALRVTVTLPDDRPALLRMFDASGRRVHRRELRGQGPHVMELGQDGEFAAGVYLLRLEHGGLSRTTRACILR